MVDGEAFDAAGGDLLLLARIDVLPRRFSRRLPNLAEIIRPQRRSFAAPGKRRPR